jgi:hypothetical protein
VKQLLRTFSHHKFSSIDREILGFLEHRHSRRAHLGGGKNKKGKYLFLLPLAALTHTAYGEAVPRVELKIE